MTKAERERVQRFSASVNEGYQLLLQGLDRPIFNAADRLIQARDALSLGLREFTAGESKRKSGTHGGD